MAIEPFTEDEQRFLLTEILKASTVSVETLLNVIRDEEIEPTWDLVGLPSGRNVRNSTAEFNRLLGLDPSQPMSQRHQRAHLAAEHYKAPSPATKTREIKPKPVSNGAQGPATPAPAAGTPRRRGRPSNAELAQRAKEAAERGEDYQGTSASKKRKSIAELSGAGSPTSGSEPPVKRGRGRPPKNKPSVPNPGIGDAKPSEAGLVGAGLTEEVLQRNATVQDADDAADTLDVISPRPKPHIPSEVLTKILNTGQADMDVLEQENMAF